MISSSTLHNLQQHELLHQPTTVNQVESTVFPIIYIEEHIIAEHHVYPLVHKWKNNTGFQCQLCIPELRWTINARECSSDNPLQTAYVGKAPIVKCNFFIASLAENITFTY